MIASGRCSLRRVAGRVPSLIQTERLRLQIRRYSSGEAQPDIYDVVIVGGGPAGLGLASALGAHQATSNLKVALIEGQDVTKSAQAFASSPATQYSNRCSSLTPASVGFLKDIGAYNYLNHDRLQPYSHMSVWDGVTGQSIHFDWESGVGLPFLTSTPPPGSNARRTIATMAENSNLTSALLSNMSSVAKNTTLFHSTRVSDISLGSNTRSVDFSSWPILTLSNGARVAARLLVGADGPNSAVRTFADIKSHGWDYERHGVVATLKLSDVDTSKAATAYQRFLPTGPVALLPLPSGYASLVWTTTPRNASVLKSLAAEDFTAMVNSAFRLGTPDLEYMHAVSEGQADELAWREPHTQIDASLVPPKVIQGDEGVQAGSVASFPLRMRHASAYTGERVALVGDAAHTIHPLAGQGLNLGLADVKSLARVIAETAERGGDVGDQISLESYASERYARNHVMLGVCDKLHKLYSWESGPVVWGRSLGLGLVERFGGLKGIVMSAAG